MKPLEFEKLTVDDAKQNNQHPFEHSVAKAGPADPVTLRAPQHPEKVQDDTVRWLATLPDHVRPVELTRKYPRIANKIATLWRRVARCEEFLDDLVVDHRGGRRGFPMAIAQELTALRRYYAVLHPNSNSVWDMEGKGR